MTRNRSRLAIPALALLAGVAASALAADLPQLGKAPRRSVVAAMTREEKVSLVVGAGMRRPGLSADRQGPVIGETTKGVPGAAGTTVPVSRLGIPAIVVADGPAGLRISRTRRRRVAARTTARPSRSTRCSRPPGTRSSSSASAARWATRCWSTASTSCSGPGLNIHRNPLCGRNFEYYSEDPLMTGQMAAANGERHQSQGVGTSIKHFAANDPEMEPQRDRRARQPARAARDLPRGLPDRRAGGATVDGDVLLQQDQRRPTRRRAASS